MTPLYLTDKWEKVSRDAMLQDDGDIVRSDLAEIDQGEEASNTVWK